MNRREFLGLAALPLAQLLDQKDVRAIAGCRRSPWMGAACDGVELIRDVDRAALPIARSSTAAGRAVRIKEVVLFDVELAMPPATGAVRRRLSDADADRWHARRAGRLQPVHRREALPHSRRPKAPRAFYGLLTLTPPERRHDACAFTSCARFSGRFEIASALGASSTSRGLSGGRRHSEGLSLGAGRNLGRSKI